MAVSPLSLNSKFHHFCSNSATDIYISILAYHSRYNIARDILENLKCTDGHDGNCLSFWLWTYFSVTCESNKFIIRTNFRYKRNSYYSQSSHRSEELAALIKINYLLNQLGKSKKILKKSVFPNKRKIKFLTECELQLTFKFT